MEKFSTSSLLNMNNLSVTKSNTLIDASYKLNVQAQKLVLACLGKVDSRKEIPKEMTITALEFSELMGIPNAHRELYLATDALYESTISLREGNNDIELRWIQRKSKKIKGLGSVTITWSDEVLKYISTLQSRFTSYKLRHIAELQSSHSIRLYELLMRFNSTGERIISLKDFKSSLGLSSKYPLFKDLNKWVIKPAVSELNQRSDLIIELETIKKGRTVTALSFTFKQNKQLKLDV
ncbi:replication initiation protein [Shewanella sp. 10N.261.52.F9]|uniref:replication initiation protein n=1 Tax=Shewanella sp. 10N.261.52.F9 TaxID=3229684 RepID=UPI00354B3E45